MHVHFEQNNSTRTECTLHSLSWMGKVPESLPENDGGWKLNRHQYYMEGWLASGNGKGVVGVTFTTSHCKKYEPPQRSNFNLRGHRSEVILVRWNEPYQKLATCDSQGVIFVWIKHEGRWSIELINDRNSQVTDFNWSHDGRMALICYCDGFVLVGSVAGQRYWSSMLNLDSTVITCGIWSADDQKVLFGTTDGQIIVMSSTGAMITQVIVNEGNEIVSMLWSCEKFNMDETESKSTSTNERDSQPSIASSRSSSLDHTLSLCFRSGTIFLMSNFDDICPRIIQTSLTGLKLDWSNCGEILAVGGFTRLPNLQCKNQLYFYNKDGRQIHSVSIPSQGKPLTALSWGHNDRRIFIASGFNLFVAWVTKQVAPLQFTCQRTIQRAISQERNIYRLPLPSRLRHGVLALFSPTIKSYIPDPFKLREFVSCPPPGSERLYCTMVRHGEETSGGHYTLYLEYLGGLIPLLKGKRASKLRPDFVIFDPKIKAKSTIEDGFVVDYEKDSTPSDSDDDIQSDGCGSPRMQRKKRPKTFRAEKVERSITFRTLDELLYNDSLPESSRLVEVTSNIWGTKFRMSGVAQFLPEDLGQILYKTSLLHLQPRQMTITLTGLSKVDQPLFRDPTFTPAGYGDEDASLSYNGAVVENDGQIQDESILVVTETCNSDGNNKQSNHVVVDVVPSPVSAMQIDDKPYLELNGTFSNGGDKACRTTNMKNRTLSPASESLAQNNAFNADNGNMLKEKYTSQGAKPKVRSTALAGSSNDIALSSTNSVQEVTGSPTNSSSNSSVLLRTSLHNEVECIMKDEEESRWADLANPGIKFIDDENNMARMEAMHENSSGLICDSSQLTPTLSDTHKRLYLGSQVSIEMEMEDSCKTCDERRQSFNSIATDDENSLEIFGSNDNVLSSEVLNDLTNSLPRHSIDIGVQAYSDVVDRDSFTRRNSGLEINHSASLPASPIKRNLQLDSPSLTLREEVLRAKCKHYSPIFRRKSKYCQDVDDDSENELCTAEEMRYRHHQFKNLESFQKAQLKQKLKHSRGKGVDRSRIVPAGMRQFVMHNKAPIWNENSQVMQFGRIDSNAYTLDFQYPFTALQAFAVALANVTQRLK
ncbi:hypothetical protein FSP39_001289 [Pinctada imbricata]|uniref:SOCS box domain-containing protein n=1 Tax=Pinctada imbricata TaxID=66713 RepID=A0AA88YGR3_PINIB|nr:hypothetical protein FSP39_001289 [Pinctada imbricata]